MPDGFSLPLHAPLTASATHFIPSLTHLAEGHPLFTSPVSTFWEDPSGSPPTSNLRRKLSRHTIAKKLHARNLAIRTGERMALRIHMGDICGRSRRNAGSRVAQANMTASLGSSKCKVFCRNIIMRNRKRFMSSRLSRPVVLSLNEGIKIILTNKWELSRIGKKALKTSRKLLVLHDIKSALSCGP